MDHASDSAYFLERVTQSRLAASAAIDISSRISHQRLAAAYENRVLELAAAITLAAEANVATCGDVVRPINV